MQTRMIEVDEDMYQVTTEYDDGSVTVEYYVGRDAYELRSREDTHGRNPRLISQGYAARRGHQLVLLD